VPVLLTGAAWLAVRDCVAGLTSVIDPPLVVVIEVGQNVARVFAGDEDTDYSMTQIVEDLAAAVVAG
jgi:hypothetical protein